MDPLHERAICQAASLAFHLAAIENALRVAEELGALRLLPETIRWHLQQAETVAADDLARSRRVIRGDYSR